MSVRVADKIIFDDYGELKGCPANTTFSDWECTYIKEGVMKGIYPVVDVYFKKGNKKIDVCYFKDFYDKYVINPKPVVGQLYSLKTYDRNNRGYINFNIIQQRYVKKELNELRNCLQQGAKQVKVIGIWPHKNFKTGEILDNVMDVGIVWNNDTFITYLLASVEVIEKYGIEKGKEFELTLNKDSGKFKVEWELIDYDNNNDYIEDDELENRRGNNSDQARYDRGEIDYEDTWMSEFWDENDWHG